MASVAQRSGFIALVGQPNVGKSTLLNRIVGEQIAITSHRPQTTRNRIAGVVTTDSWQGVFIDTPGAQAQGGSLADYMREAARGALESADVVVLVVEAGTDRDGEVGISRANIGLVEQLKGLDKPTCLALNKIDRVPALTLLPVIDAWRKQLELFALVPLSARTGDGVDVLVREVSERLPSGTPLYPPDTLTDVSQRFIAAEVIRERVFHLLEQEVPYATAVTIDAWRDDSSRGLVAIQAAIHVERESQKGIVIGRGGRTIKEIGTGARLRLEEVLGARVHLDLRVRVEPEWSRAEAGLRKLGYV